MNAVFLIQAKRPSEQNEAKIIEIRVDPAESEIFPQVTKLCYGPLFAINLAGVLLTQVFITALYPARGAARARGKTEVRHPQCRGSHTTCFPEG